MKGVSSVGFEKRRHVVFNSCNLMIASLLTVLLLHILKAGMKKLHIRRFLTAVHDLKQ